jgi:hypothetical protein
VGLALRWVAAGQGFERLAPGRFGAPPVGRSRPPAPLGQFCRGGYAAAAARCDDSDVLDAKRNQFVCVAALARANLSESSTRPIRTLVTRHSDSGDKNRVYPPDSGDTY